MYTILALFLSLSAYAGESSPSLHEGPSAAQFKTRPAALFNGARPVVLPLHMQPKYSAYGRTRDWASVDKAAYRTYQAGWITGLAGSGLLVIGIAAVSPETTAIGALAVLAGPPIMSGGSLRSARALRELGYSVPTTNGMVAWGLWGGSMGLSLMASATLDPDLTIILAVLSTGSLVSSYVLATQQNAANNRGRNKAGLVGVGIRPVLTRDGLAVSLSGQW